MLVVVRGFLEDSIFDTLSIVIVILLFILVAYGYVCTFFQSSCQEVFLIFFKILIFPWKGLISAYANPFGGGYQI